MDFSRMFENYGIIRLHYWYGITFCFVLIIHLECILTTFRVLWLHLERNLLRECRKIWNCIKTAMYLDTLNKCCIHINYNVSNWIRTMKICASPAGLLKLNLGAQSSFQYLKSCVTVYYLVYLMGQTSDHVKNNAQILSLTYWKTMSGQIADSSS